MKARVLVVEDEECISNLLTESLSAAGYGVDAVSDGLLALQVLRSKSNPTDSFDIVITDIDMPRMDGITLARHIHDEFTGLPVIAITGCGNMSTVVELLRCGVCEYLDKPFVISQLIERIDTILGQNEPSQDQAEVASMRQEMHNLINSEVEQQKKQILEWVKGGINHRFNQPLTVLLGNISVLSQMLSPERIATANPNEITDIIKDLRNAGYCLKDMVKLVSNLQGFQTEDYVGDEKILALGGDKSEQD